MHAVLFSGSTTTSIALWMAVAVLAATGVCALLWRGRQRNAILARQTLLAHGTQQRSLAMHRRVDDANPIALVAIRADGDKHSITYANAAFLRLSHCPADEVIGRSYWDVLGATSGQSGAQALRQLIDSGNAGQAVLISHRQQGGLAWHAVQVAPLAPDAMRDGAPALRQSILAHVDITDTRRHEAELERNASHDALTGLANRSLMQRRLREAISGANSGAHQVWVVFLDLDRFKSINDSLGHKAGDCLLRVLAERLSHIVRDTDTVARLGGDEFVLILRETEQQTISTAAVQRLIDAVAEPVAVEGHELVLTCSVGIAIFPEHSDDGEQLVEYADIAMYNAKQRGRNTYRFYEAALNERALSRLVMESALRTAVERDQFCLHYQPQVDLKSGSIVGMEALIYWRHPTLGIVPPNDFIGLAEETGLIVAIGEWVMREACRQNKAWQDAGLGFLRVAVNLSPRQFADPDLVASVNRILRETGLAPRYLEIELTENLIMMEITRAVDILTQLKAHGIQLSIDDFGTGYSSLSYLKRFPIDVLKIDRTFIKDIGTDADDEAIVKSIITLAHSLKLHVIAEGVETPAQLAFLAQLGCDEFQGFYFSKPLAPTVFGHMLENQRPAKASSQLLH